MTKTCLLLLIVATVPLAGCINLSFGSRRPPPPPAIVAPIPPLSGDEVATMAEIDAAAKLSFDSARKDSLIQVAQRAGLSPTVQVHLVNVGYRCLSFDTSKMDVLRALIANPAFSDAARQAIVTQLNHLQFDSHKQSILRQLDQRVKT